MMLFSCSLKGELRKHSVHPFCPVSSHQQSRCYGLSQLWEQVADPLPWSLSCLVMCVQLSEIDSVCSVLLRKNVFPNISLTLLFSFSQVMFQVGWQSKACSHRRSRKFVSRVQKHVLTVPHLVGYWLLKSFFSAVTWHNTLDSFYFDTLK